MSERVAYINREEASANRRDGYIPDVVGYWWQEDDGTFRGPYESEHEASHAANDYEDELVQP